MERTSPRSAWRLAACLGLSLALTLAMPAEAMARQASARAFLSRGEVGVGQQFVLNVEVSGTQQIDRDPDLPDLTAFSVYLGSGTSTSLQTVSGRTSVAVTVQYRFQATREGTFPIAPVTVHAGGNTYTTEAVSLTVSGSATPSGTRQGTATGEPEVGRDDLFVSAEPSTRRVYENQPIIVEYRIYTRVNVSSYSVTQLPAASGFWVEEFPLPQQPQVEHVVRNGQQYTTATIRKVALFPTGPGTRTLEPLGIEAQVRVRRPSFDPFEDFFGRSSLLGSTVPTATASQSIEVEVLPLPTEGRPPTFSGFVGGLEVAAALDRDSVAANEAVTLSVAVSGTGNLRTLPEPEIDIPPGFEAFPPEVSERIDRTDRGVSGSRRYEYVLIPRVPGISTIAPLEIGYFDPDREEYVVVATDPLTVEVTGTTEEGPVGAGRARRGVEELRTDIRFIHIGNPRLTRANRSLLAHPVFWLTLLLPLVAIGGAASVRSHRDRLRGDVAYARARRASRVAKKRLGRAGALADGDDAREFYAETGRALEGFLADKLNIAAAGMIRGEVRDRLRAMGIDTETALEYLGCLEECDRQRFAPPGSTVEERRTFLGRVESAMSDMGQRLAQ